MEAEPMVLVSTVLTITFFVVWLFSDLGNAIFTTIILAVIISFVDAEQVVTQLEEAELFTPQHEESYTVQE